ncbi:alpha-1,2-fucosyltransferase [Polynucleobacter sp. 86C-FISCH]|uniref:alpha-1,2-fucosyltransferase n=1 Tax=Polynucleobacter sp. 86C-FISCH TaxID=2689101 RepID=UPI001C0DBE24|nr:alpha-1,2-fucosyltransferase [Polynucleobacter sp. 86C-FISCH]MBU3596006.1 alpha-1,2-fucosyltransferase [Polynucleobacter sp. 86C-FISCH]
MVNKKKLVARIKGGLGNQLFCYAAARRLAIVNNATLVLDDVSGFLRDFKYQRKYSLDKFYIPIGVASSNERLGPFPRILRRILRMLSRFNLCDRFNYIYQEYEDFDSRILDIKIIKYAYIDGLWQSEDYFKDVEDVIRQDLRIKQPIDIENLSMAAKIENCNSVALHVRWFNNGYEDLDSSNLSMEYYNSAIEKINTLINNPHFFIFSDKPFDASLMLNLSHDKFTLVTHNSQESMAYADLWLMSLCKYFIIANSTFSWWGAWLGNFKSKIVIAPSLNITGVGSWGFKGLIPKDWIKV